MCVKLRLLKRYGDTLKIANNNNNKSKNTPKHTAIILNKTPERKRTIVLSQFVK